VNSYFTTITTLSQALRNSSSIYQDGHGYCWDTLYLFGLLEMDRRLFATLQICVLAACILSWDSTTCKQCLCQLVLTFIIPGLVLGFWLSEQNSHVPTSFCISELQFSVGNFRRALPRVPAALLVLAIISIPFLLLHFL